MLYIKKIILCIFVLIISASVVDAQIRNTAWGQNPSEVKEAITGEIVMDQDGEGATKGQYIIGEQNSCGSLDCLIAYYFIDNQLFSIRYIMTESYTNENNHITDFNNIDEALTEKYGEPTNHDKIWRDDLYRDDPSDYGFAISLGHYILRSTWDLADLNITHVVSGNDYDITHAVEYLSVDLMHLKEELEEENTISDF